MRSPQDGSGTLDGKIGVTRCPRGGRFSAAGLPTVLRFLDLNQQSP